MRVMRYDVAAALLVLATCAVSAAQGVNPATGPAGGGSGQQAPAEVYTYESGGRRDPFVSLLGTGLEGRAASRTGEGPAGLSVSDVSVRGVMESRGELIAMVQGPDNRTYIVHAGDKFLDGVIKSVTPQGLVIVQDVNDPLSLVKQREIRKLLRSAEDAKK